MIICDSCKHYKNGCDILNQIQNIANTYGLELNVKISKCDACGASYKSLAQTLHDQRSARLSKNYLHECGSMNGDDA